MEVPERPVQLPSWSWSYVAFRFGDGLSSAVIPLTVVLHYNMPLWALALATAAQNLAAVPATFVWAAIMDRGIRRRPIVVTGFAVASLAMILMAALPPFPIFVGLAMAYTVFGSATAPAASTLVLQRVSRAMWGRTTAALSRRTGFAYLSGLALSILIALGPDVWQRMGRLGVWLLGHDLVGGPHFGNVFAITAAAGALAAIVASRLIPPYQPPLPHEMPFDAGLIQAGQRRFERAVFFPSRLRNSPTVQGVVQALSGPGRLWPVGYLLTFTGSVCFFASYPGVLAGHLALPAALVLVAQAPSNIVTPITYPWAGRLGARLGEAVGILEGSILRTITLPLLCITVAFVGVPGYAILLMLHAMMGLSFSLLQVNGPVLLADIHPGGRGAGVGTYHAAIGAGTLLGSLSAFAILRVADFRWSYVFAVAVAVSGMLVLLAADRQTRAARKASPIT
ncbi:MAG: MFS transporter [bacterium]